MTNPIIDLKQQLLAAAERQYARGTSRVGWRRLSRTRLLLVAAILLAVGGAALFVAAPGSGPPNFLERAQAALTPPAGTVLHEKWELTSTSTDPACTVTRGPSEIWIDETPPHRYRVLLNDLPPNPWDYGWAISVCARGTASELGGSFDTGETMRFVPPDTLSTNTLTFVWPPDTVQMVREAISAGRAHDEGKTQLDGRTVERIRFDPPASCAVFCMREPAYAYVDPQTFQPIETDGPGQFALPGRPVVRLHMVFRFLTFETLPRTPANLALTNIRTQHPHATITP